MNEKLKRHAPTKAREITRREINKGPTTDNGVGASSLEIRTGIFFQVGYPMATSHFAATPQSNVVRICARDFQCHGDAFGTTENACFRAFITLRSQFTYIIVLMNFNGNRVKNHPKPWNCVLSMCHI